MPRKKKKKVEVEAKPEVKEEEWRSGIEVGQNLSRSRSPFSIEKFGVKRDPNKDYRWVEKSRIEERKYNDGYTFTKNGAAEDGTHRTKGNMVLMERSRALADESRRIKDQKTREMTQGAKSDFRNRIENLSRSHDIDLHKNINHLDHED